MATAHGTSWRALAARGFADLSPPEAVHALLELPTDRAEYVGVLEDIGDYPARSPIGHRVPSEAEVAALCELNGSWRAVVLLEDERALRTTACLFDRAFVLDPFYDSGALLYAAWHDPIINDEHARRLADHAGRLVRAAPLLQAGTAVLAPDHLPGSWNPRPGWRQPRPTDRASELAGWWMRTALVLLYWADRLDGVVCTTRAEVVAALDVALGPGGAGWSFKTAEPPGIEAALALREALAPAVSIETHTTTAWRLLLGDPGVPEPAMLIRRVLNGEPPDRAPRLPRKELRRAPLCLLPASARVLGGAMGVLDDAHLVDRDRAGRDHGTDAG